MTDAPVPAPPGPANPAEPGSPTVVRQPWPATVAATELRPGSVLRSDPLERLPRPFGKYRLDAELGRGGMGVVYQAWHPGLKTHVALKVLRAGDCADREEVDRFEREAQALARLKHPGIVAVHDIGIEEGRTYFAMEYVEGATLDTALAEPGRFGAVPARGRALGKRPGIQAVTAVRWVREIAEALDAAHRAGVFHRDLKPSNILIAASEPGRAGGTGRLKVSDFGLAKFADAADSGATRSGVVLGTPAYMSPEQAQGRVRDIDARSDVYQLGAILYELLSGAPPYLGATAHEVITRVLSEDPPPLRRAGSGLDADAITICATAMAREKEDRYPTAAALAEDCRRWLEGEPIRARPEAWWARSVRWARRRPALSVLAAIALLLLLASSIVGGEALRGRRRQAQLERDVLSGLRTIAAVSLEAVLELRRAGRPMADVAPRFLPRLREAAEAAARQAPDLAEPHYRLGRMYRALLDSESAREAQEAALVREPGYLPARYERAILIAHELRNHLTAARADLLQAEGRRLAATGELDPGGSSGTVRGPSPASIASDPRVATSFRRLLEDVRAVLEGDPTVLGAARREVVQGLAGMYGSTTREAARGHVQRAIELDPTLEEAYETLAEIEAARGDLAAAIEVLTRGLAADPGYVMFWVYRGSRRNDLALRSSPGPEAEAAYAAAAADLSRALDLDPTLRSARIVRGGVHANWTRWVESRGGDGEELRTKALADLDAVLAIAPDDASTRVFRANVCLNDGARRAERGLDPLPRWRSAREDYDRALGRIPDSARVRVFRAMLSRELGKYLDGRGSDPLPHFREAEADLARALELDAADPLAWQLRGELGSVWGLYEARHGIDPRPRWRGAQADLDRAIDRPDPPIDAFEIRARVRHNLAAVGVERGEDGRAGCVAALADLDRVLQKDPGCSSAWLQRGISATNLAAERMRHGEDPVPPSRDAVAAFTRVLERAPEHAEARPARGRSRSFLGWLAERAGASPLDDYLGALDDLASHARAHPEDATVLPALGQTRLNLGLWRIGRGEDGEPDLAAAIETFDRYLAVDSASAEAWYQRGCAHGARALFRERKREEARAGYEAAERDLNEALARRPDHAQAQVALRTTQQALERLRSK